MNKTSSIKKAQKKYSSSIPIQKSASKSKLKNPLSKKVKTKTELINYFPISSLPRGDFISNIRIIKHFIKCIIISKKKNSKAS